MAFKIQLRRDLAPKWTENNPVLLLGEFGYEYDSGYAKIGDGQTPWRDLKYFVGGTGPFGAKDFISLSDTPAGYTGSNEFFVRVNPNGNGLEFISTEMLTSLIDIRGATGFEPGDAGLYLSVNSGGTGFVWDTPASGVGGLYSNSLPMENKVGGLENLTTFSDAFLEQMWDSLLYPEQQPAFNSLEITPDNSPVSYIKMEIGNSIDEVINLHWNISESQKIKPSTINIEDSKLGLPIANNIPLNSSPVQYSYTNPISYSDKDYHEWTFSAKGINGIDFAKKLIVNWYYPIFIGKNPSENVQILTLPKYIQPNSEGQYNIIASTNEYVYICIPNAEPDYEIKGIIVNNMPLALADSEDGYDLIDTAGLNYSLLTSVNINGITKQYRSYRSKYKIDKDLVVSITNIELSTGLKITGIIKPVSESEDYPVLDPKYGIDGLRNVFLDSERYSIPYERRRLGMIVGVGIAGSPRIYYKLTNEPGSGYNTTSTDWEVFDTGAITYNGGTGGTGPNIVGATGMTIKGGERITVVLAENPIGVAEYTIDLPQLISGGKA